MVIGHGVKHSAARCPSFQQQKLASPLAIGSSLMPGVFMEFQQVDLHLCGHVVPCSQVALHPLGR